MCKMCNNADLIIEFVESLMDEKTRKEMEDDINVPESERSREGSVLAVLGSAYAEYGFRNQVHPIYLADGLAKSYNKRVIEAVTGHRKSDLEKKLDDYQS